MGMVRKMFSEGDMGSLAVARRGVWGVNCVAEPHELNGRWILNERPCACVYLCNVTCTVDAWGQADMWATCVHPGPANKPRGEVDIPNTTHTHTPVWAGPMDLATQPQADGTCVPWPSGGHVAIWEDQNSTTNACHGENVCVPQGCKWHWLLSNSYVLAPVGPVW